jgi:hypothetical protein
MKGIWEDYRSASLSIYSGTEGVVSFLLTSSSATMDADSAVSIVSAFTFTTLSLSVVIHWTRRASFNDF